MLEGLLDRTALVLGPLTVDMVLVLLILAITVLLFVTEVVRVDVAALISMVVLGLAGVVPGNEVFSGFASNAVISVVAIMIVGAALDRVGVMREVAAFIQRVGAGTERRLVASTSLTAGLISGFMQNIGAAALFLPVVERLSRATGASVSRMLMPLGFATILGGSLTLVGAGPMILLNDLLAASGETLGVEVEPFGLFSPFPIGSALLVGGVALFALGGRWLLPDRTDGDHASNGLASIGARYGLDGTIRAYAVPPGSPVVGLDVETVERVNPGVLVAAVDGGAEGPTLAPARDVVITAGVSLGLVGPSRLIDAFVDAAALVAAVGPGPFARFSDEERFGLMEVVVRPGGAADHRQVRDLRVRHRLGLAVLAVLQDGTVHTDGLRERTVRAGDVLVLFGEWGRLAELDPRALVAISESPADPIRPGGRARALLWAAVAMTMVAAGLPLSLALMTGAVGMLVTGVLTADEAYRAVSWKTVFLLAALIPLGQAVERSGTAAWIASGLVGAIADLPALAVLLVIGSITTVFTLVVSNVGATVLLVPLAANVAVGLDADPRAFAMMVAIAASNSFILPTHQVNALLMGPGGYRVGDYLRAGTAMSVLFLLIAAPMVLLVL
jgi:di/tricarboxylate transporter